MADELHSRSEQLQIQVRDLHMSFGMQHVLRGVNLDIERRKTNIIIGGSGQGKPVLMKHLMGLLARNSGHIFIDGQDIIGSEGTP
jgi:phospholipid/cholesterol/gamma-HCH transport system ATP-binding protein